MKDKKNKITVEIKSWAEHKTETQETPTGQHKTIKDKLAKLNKRKVKK